ncbi:MAG: hypothetical protein ACLQSR_06585 [Limisphaerales bacterium]
MQEKIIILLGLAIMVWAFARRPMRIKPAWFGHLNGWQKLFGLIAVILAVLILINPEFLALGLLGDTAFFDMLVFALSLQMLVFVQTAWRSIGTALARSLRWIGIPSPGFRFLLAISTVAIGSAICSIQKVVHRILS